MINAHIKEGNQFNNLNLYLKDEEKEQTKPAWCKELTHWERPWYWERLKAGGGGNDRGWDGWIVSLTRRAWVWASSGSWWWTRKPGVLQCMGSQRIRHNWVTELLLLLLLHWLKRKISRRKEVTKIRAEMKEIEDRKIIEKIGKKRIVFLKK